MFDSDFGPDLMALLTREVLRERTAALIAESCAWAVGLSDQPHHLRVRGRVVPTGLTIGARAATGQALGGEEDGRLDLGDARPGSFQDALNSVTADGTLIAEHFDREVIEPFVLDTCVLAAERARDTRAAAWAELLDELGEDGRDLVEVVRVAEWEAPLRIEAEHLVLAALGVVPLVEVEAEGLPLSLVRAAEAVTRAAAPPRAGGRARPPRRAGRGAVPGRGGAAASGLDPAGAAAGGGPAARRAARRGAAARGGAGAAGPPPRRAGHRRRGAGHDRHPRVAAPRVPACHPSGSRPAGRPWRGTHAPEGQCHDQSSHPRPHGPAQPPPAPDPLVMTRGGEGHLRVGGAARRRRPRVAGRHPGDIALYLAQSRSRERRDDAARPRPEHRRAAAQPRLVPPNTEETWFRLAPPERRSRRPRGLGLSARGQARPGPAPAGSRSRSARCRAGRRRRPPRPPPARRR